MLTSHPAGPAGATAPRPTFPSPNQLNNSTGPPSSSADHCSRISTDPSLTSHRMQHHKDSANSFDPPPTFSLVHPSLYRASSHHFTNHSTYFRSLKLTTILLLGLELPNAGLKAWCDKHAVRLVRHGAARRRSSTCPSCADWAIAAMQVHLPSDGQHSSWQPIPEETIKEGLEHILNRDNLPCLVMDPSVQAFSRSPQLQPPS